MEPSPNPAPALWAAPLVLATLATAAGSGGPSDPGAPAVDFQREVRPLLSENCYACHGPDQARREAGLRLDTRSGALAELADGRRAVVAGAPGASELLRRVTAGEAERMPPPETGKELAGEEVELLRRWIEEGAVWEQHWAFVPPVRREPPAVAREEWVRNPIDRFVLARLEAEGRAPAPEAARETLIRRASYDLTGLPPSIDELDAFLADEDTGAYERLVDRLLASPRHGEHQARYWLDAARYGDTHGFHLDNRRNLWHWREWVIRAINANKPFDEFVVEQLAGDLLPDATREQRIATGFNRCNPTTGEGGLIEEEYLVKYAFDRVDTFGTVFLGMTIGCAQCHEHKFDPVSQEEYYRLFAFFNNLAEEGTDRNALTPPPALKVPGPEQAARQTALAGAIAALEERAAGPMPEADAAQVAWEREWGARLGGRWAILERLWAASAEGSVLEVLEDSSVRASGPDPEREVYTVVAHSPAERISALRLELLTDASLPQGGVSRASHANLVLSGFEVEALPLDGAGAPQRVELVSAGADYAQKGFPITGAIDDDPRSGWAIDGLIEDRVAVFLPEEPFGFPGGTELRVRLRFESSYTRHNIGRFRLAVTGDPELAPARLGTWHESGPYVAETGQIAYDTEYAPERALASGGAPELAVPPEGGGLDWTPRPEYADGEIHTWTGDDRAYYLYRAIESPSARTMTVAVGSDDAIEVWLNGAVVLDRNVARAVAPEQDRLLLQLAPGTNQLLLKVVNFKGGFGFWFAVLSDDAGGLDPGLERVLARPVAARGEAGRARLRDHFRRNHSAPYAALVAELERSRAELRELEAEIPSTMVCAEREEVRPAYLLKRGQYDQKGARVLRGVPAVLPPLPPPPSSEPEREPDRLTLARWLFLREHPLTARVAVNRSWQQHFGTGLVRTAGDFGSQGEWPSHAELLDWLARELADGGWDLRHLQRLILTSATYRQSSSATPEDYRRDPQNRSLARGPRFRLDAEEVRDTALFLGGLLVEELGGPSVKPYQPAGLWQVVAYPSSNTARFAQDAGAALYRRSLYTFWKRTAPPPSLATFDAPAREACRVRRARTNTPLQALVLLNDVQFVEAARAFGQRILREGGETDAQRLSFALRAATARRPSREESALLLSFLLEARIEFSADPDAARALIATGDSAPDPALAPVELAAWTVVASAILNLDETITKG